jgi:Mn-dependent DtxR family transcriptional regulator
MVMSDIAVEKTEHSEFLSKLYEMAKGKPSQEKISELSKELDIDIRQAQEICLSLETEGLVSIFAGEYVRLTSKGTETVQKEQGPRPPQPWWRRLFK